MQALQDYQQRLTELVHHDRDRKQPLSALAGFDSACMKEGYLQKKGQRFKSWKRRWFVCNGRTLSYYISRKDRKPNAVIPLESCTVEDGGISETWNSPRIYLTDGTSGTMYCLSAEEAEVVTAWLNVLRTAIAKVLEGEAPAPINPAGSSSSVPKPTKRALAKEQATSDATGASVVSSVSASAPVKTLANYSDDDADRFQSQPLPVRPAMTRTVSLMSGSSSVADIKRPTRLVSGPTHLGARGGRAKTQHQPTSIALENELASGLDMLEALLTSRGSARHSLIFRPIAAAPGVLKSVGSDPTGVKTYARASAVLPVPSEVAAFYITDHAKRAEWDLHFPRSMHVASFDESTELIHITGGFRQIDATAPFVAPHIAAAIGSLVGAVLAPSWETTFVSALITGVLAALINSVDYSTAMLPRDLLILRHVRESSAPSVSDLADVDGDDAQPVVMILEKSVVNELKPETASTAVRANVGLSGWLLEPVEGSRTRATYVTDIDMRGVTSRDTKRRFLLERLDCVAVLLEQLTQSQLCGADGGLDEDHASVGDGRDDDDEQGSVAYVEDEEGDGQFSSSEFHPSVYMKGMMQIPSGGLKLIDKEVAKKQGGVLKDVIKSAGAKILEGKGTVSLSLPVRIFEPRTNLERIVDLFLYGPTFLNAAAEQSDPVERLKLVMSFAVAGMHHSVGQLKPFNPILGETYQTALNDGTEVCCEHTSHHPPISNFQLVGKKYSISGYIWWHGTFSMKSNAVIQNNRGPIRVGFEDGSVISYNLPVMQSGGFLWGDRTVELTGSTIFEDKKNGLQCELRFNPDEKKGMGGMFSASKTPSDQVRGVIVNTSTGAELCEVTGSWLESLRFGDKPYWVYGRERSGYTLPMVEDKILESDSRNREDLRYLAANDLDAAQDWKVRLEVLQRADRKVRTDGRRANHWSFKADKSAH